MSDFKAKMHQIRFRLGLCPRPRWGSLPPDLLAGFYGVSYLMSVLLSFVVKLLNIRGVVPLRHLRHVPPQTVMFVVSFPEKLLKIVATGGEIFSLKFTNYRLAGGLRPDPLGELKRSSRAPSIVGL